MIEIIGILIFKVFIALWGETFAKRL